MDTKTERAAAKTDRVTVLSVIAPCLNEEGNIDWASVPNARSVVEEVKNLNRAISLVNLYSSILGSALTPYEMVDPETGEVSYDVTSAIQDGAIPESLLEMAFGEETIEPIVTMVSEMEPYQTEEGWDIVTALQQGIDYDTLVGYFDLRQRTHP